MFTIVIFERFYYDKSTKILYNYDMFSGVNVYPDHL